MFWTNCKSQSTKASISTAQVAWDTKFDSSPSVAFIENSSNPDSYNPTSIITSNDALPFIKAETIAEASRNDLLWIIIDDIVYDCTEFIHNHPGGARVIESFRGSNCTWQFWRFHSEKDLAEFGPSLRIGQTKGIQNKFKEPPRFVGLRKFWGADS
ncbi:cytochrome b5-like heme/steroid binding domain-containing protein [Fusarium tricinctum]|uniref:Cytochrome b5-like heme/steroid binding domain-containing protein n=1 Tax=Fusarium tricinctum TaxID=61284 RepID=A0A8K0RKG7_9HYPO|nr:cytochrome b5-like heme/steroid binding domain-containing protein [Fusarium tricinctum]